MTIKDLWTKEIIEAVDLSLGHFTFGKAPAFPLDAFQEKLATFFNLPQLQLEIIKADYYKPDQILKSAGLNPTIIALELSPLNAPFFISFTKEDINLLNSLVMAQDLSSSFHEAELQKGFFRFYLLQTLQEFKKMNPLEGLSIRLSDEQLKAKESYILEVGISSNEKKAIIRVIIPLDFQDQFSKFYTSKKIPLKDRVNFKNLNLTLSLTSGSLVLSHAEIKNIKIGDLIVLDHSSYQPKSKKGYFKLSYKNYPLFQIKLKEDQFKILDYIASGDEKLMDDSENEDFLEEEMEPELSHEFEEELIENTESHENLIDPTQINMTLLVEVGQFDMNLDNLLQLKPGSMIPLAKRPEEGVYLTLNQKKIAKGELIQMGDVIGVKILETY